MESEAAKKNAPHIKSAEQIIDEIKGVADLVKLDKQDRDVTEEELDLNHTMKTLIQGIQGRFNNREMSLVVTNLQVASFFIRNEKPFKLYESYFWIAQWWVEEYIRSLKEA